jgi:hypothetical protein
MRIISVQRVTATMVETDSKPHSTYRRNSANNWEVLMGLSWETMWGEEEAELEKAYLNYLKEKKKRK